MTDLTDRADLADLADLVDLANLADLADLSDLSDLTDLTDLTDMCHRLMDFLPLESTPQSTMMTYLRMDGRTDGQNRILRCYRI